MSRKVNLTPSRKSYLKENFNRIKKNDLTKEEQRYYTLIENGKKRAKNSVRFEGRYLGGEIVELIKKAAKNRGVSVEAYMNQHKEAIVGMMESGFTETSKSPEDTIDLIASLAKRTVEVDTGDGIVRLKRFDVIKEITALMQFAKSNSTIAALGITIKIFESGKVRVEMPLEETYEDMNAEEFEDLLDMIGVWYVKSPTKGK